MPKYLTRLPLWLCVLLALTVGVLSSTVEAAPRWRWPQTGSQADSLVAGGWDGAGPHRHRRRATSEWSHVHEWLSAARRSTSTAKAPRCDFDAVGGNFSRDPFTLAFFIKDNLARVAGDAGRSDRCATPQASGTFG